MPSLIAEDYRRSSAFNYMKSSAFNLFKLGKSIKRDRTGLARLFLPCYTARALQHALQGKSATTWHIVASKRRAFHAPNSMHEFGFLSNEAGHAQWYFWRQLLLLQNNRRCGVLVPSVSYVNESWRVRLHCSQDGTSSIVDLKKSFTFSSKLKQPCWKIKAWENML